MRPFIQRLASLFPQGYLTFSSILLCRRKSDAFSDDVDIHVSLPVVAPGWNSTIVTVLSGCV